MCINFDVQIVLLYDVVNDKFIVNCTQLVSTLCNLKLDTYTNYKTLFKSPDPQIWSWKCMELPRMFKNKIVEGYTSKDYFAQK